MRASPLKAFALATLAAIVWFAAVMLFLGGKEPAPALHMVILLVPFAVCGLIQYRLTRALPLAPSRRAIQVGAAAILAPVFATSIIFFVWVVALGHGL